MTPRNLNIITDPLLPRHLQPLTFTSTLLQHAFMQLQLTRRTIITFIIVIVGALSVTYAGYFHDQSIKGVYKDLTPANVDGWFSFTGSQCYYSCSVNGAI